MQTLGRRQAVEHVELGDRETRDAVDLDRPLERDEIDPATQRRGRPSSHRIHCRACALAHLVVEFGRDGPPPTRVAQAFAIPST